jgi:hypothetical protein
MFSSENPSCILHRPIRSPYSATYVYARVKGVGLKVAAKLGKVSWMQPHRHMELSHGASIIVWIRSTDDTDAPFFQSAMSNEQ